MSQTIVLRGVRFSWLDVLKENEKFGNYRAEILLEDGSTQDKELQAAIHEAAVEKWGSAKAPVMLKLATANRKVCRRLGSEKNPSKHTGEIDPMYDGMVVLNASRKAKRDGAPAVFCAEKSDPTKLHKVHEDSDFSNLVEARSGNYGDVIVDVWAFEFDGSPQINCTLKTAAFRSEGEPITSRATMTDEAIANALGAKIVDVFAG